MALPLASKSITFGAVSGNSAQPAIGATQSLTTLNTKNLSESNLVEGNTAEINLFASIGSYLQRLVMVLQIGKARF